MHHVPYTYKLHGGKTVIQYIYDSHYEGADAVEAYARQWKTLQGSIDDQRYKAILAQLEYQTGQAVVWRDAVTNWFQRASGIADAQGRVGHYPGRYEAESMKLDGYTPVDVTPAEDASGKKAVSCPAAKCSASMPYDGPAGKYTLRIQYFDQNPGAAHFRVVAGGRLLDEWTADDHIPSRRLDSSSSARRVIRGVDLRPGDEIRIEGTPDQTEVAGLDYIEIAPEKN
jgi:alpha-glucuronidase